MKTKRKLWQLTVLFMIMVFAAIHAAEVSESDILTAARKWISDNAVFKSEQPNAVPKKAVQMTNADGQLMPLWQVDLQPTGYLVMSSDDTLPPVVTFNTNGSFELPEGHPLPFMLRRQGKIFQEELSKPQTRGSELAAENQARWNALLNRTRASSSTTPSVIITNPLLSTEWHQGSPYDLLTPYDETHDERGAAGCVPLAISQILKYHEWPAVGVGEKYHQDSDAWPLGASLQAQYSFPYAWDLMADDYGWTDEETLTPYEWAVARLVMEMGVLVEADYEADGTGAGDGEIKYYLVDYLDYSEGIMYGQFDNSRWDDYTEAAVLYPRIRADMVAGRPALVGTADHEFVADGLGTVGSLDYYHFNYGWGGECNGWYLLTDGYAYNFTPSVITTATTNIIPNPVPVFRPMSVEQSSSFTLSWEFPKRLTVEAFRLTKTSGSNSTVISSSISGTDRSYNLTGQSGTATYTLEAKVDGTWRTASEGKTITVKDNPVPALSLTIDDELIVRRGDILTADISSNNSLQDLTVTSSRPDILPDEDIVITGQGTSYELRLMTSASNPMGNMVLYVSGVDTAGNMVLRTVPLRVTDIERVAQPVLNTDDVDYFLTSGVVTAICPTDGAVIRYTTNGDEPTSSSPVFPSEGVVVTENTVVMAKAFKEGMRESHVTTSKIYVLSAISDVQAIVSGTEVTLYSGGDTPWSLQTTTYNTSPSAMQSGAIGNDGVTILVARVVGSGDFSFSWKVSSENYYDWLSFCIDGERQDRISGSTSWFQKDYSIDGSGEHLLAWIYAKDYSFSDYNDCGWVDDIVWFSDQPELISITISGSTTIARASTATYACTATWSDGTTSTVTPSWSLSSTAYASVNANGVVTNNNTTTTNKSVTLNASYTFGGVTKTDEKAITLSVQTVIDYILTVVNGTGDGIYSEGASVTVTADTPMDNYVFSFWTAEGIVLDDDQLTTSSLTFTMPGNDVTMTATYASEYAYTVSDGKATITGYTGPKTVLAIPETIDGYPVVAIGDEAFRYKWQITSVTIPSGVSTIGRSAFAYCIALESIVIPSSLTSIGAFAFSSCSSLISMTIPASVTSIGNYAFDYCSSLASITVDSANTYYKSVDGVLFNKSGTMIVRYPPAKTGTEYSIPSDVTVIGNGAFCYSKLTSVSIPSGVTSIESYGFESSINLASVTIPSSVTTINIFAFYECTSLSVMEFEGNPPTFGSSSYPTPITFYVLPGRGWEDWTVPTGVTLEICSNMQTQAIELSSGWNWVSFNVLPESHKVGDVLGADGFTVNDIIQTNGGVARFTGASWMPGSFTVEYGKLYQIYVANDMIIEVSGNACESFTVPLVSGWNWIGNPTANAVAPSELLHSVGWTAGDRIQTAGGASVSYTGGKWIPASFTLESGKGYQIFTANEGTLTFPSASEDDNLYVVVDLSGGPDAESYPVRYSSIGPDLSDDTCRTTELWLRRIPAGTFIMGSPEDEVGRDSYDMKQHEVTLTQDYYIGVFECTQKQWELVMGSNQSECKGDCRPVESVSYKRLRGSGEQAGAGWPTYGHAVDSTSFMGILRAKTGLTFDLPTEAQWEYACRAGTTTALNSGKNLTSTSSDANMDEVGRYYFNQTDGKGGYTSEHTKVGSYRPNAWGLYDMHGNVWERCLDWFGGSPTSEANETDPVGPTSGLSRMFRGGGWNSYARDCSSACRSWDDPANGLYFIGFRVLCLP